jgi:hypothetical protein
MGAPNELWTNLWPPSLWQKQPEIRALSDAQRKTIDELFRQAVKPADGKLAIAVALGRSAEEMSSALYVYYEPLAYLVVALDPVERKVSVSANICYWPAMESRFLETTAQAEALLREQRIVEALALCIREGCEWVRMMMRLGPL